MRAIIIYTLPCSIFLRAKRGVSGIKGLAMKQHKYILLAILSFFFLQRPLNSEYWFQFGAKAGSNAAAFNNGSGISIQTIIQSNLSVGSTAYWVGENLQDGAFLQVGYLQENSSGLYPSACDTNGCKGYQNISKNQAEWFYEYFPAYYGGSSFLGRIGQDGSAGKNGTFNNYSFYSKGSIWYFTINGNVVGSTNLGTGTSGFNMPTAFGELANTSNANTVLKDVAFTNFSIDKNGAFLPLSAAYSYIGYGEGSKKGLKVPYGVAEVGNRINYYAVGSGLPQPFNNTQLWSFGYNLNIISSYANISWSSKYIAYSKIPISAPQIYAINATARALFSGWIGTGMGSYSGPLNSTSVALDGNTTEQATWQLQYLVNVSSSYSGAGNSDWYNANATASYGITSNAAYQNSSSRFVFVGWNTGVKNLSGSIRVTNPLHIVAGWTHQYLVNATSGYGNTTGSGWYNAGSQAFLSVFPTMINISRTKRIAFYSWNSGEKSSNITLDASRSLNEFAVFRPQYLTTLEGIDRYGAIVNPSYFYLDGKKANATTYLYSGERHSVTGAFYKGVLMPLNFSLEVNNSAIAYLSLPLYNLSIITTDIFGIPINATAVLLFENGTSVGMRTYGKILLNDVPYGSAIGTVEYLGLSQNVRASKGQTIRLVFMSVMDFEVFLVTMIAAALIYLVSSKTLEARNAVSGRPGR